MALQAEVLDVTLSVAEVVKKCSSDYSNNIENHFDAIQIQVTQFPVQMFPVLSALHLQV